MQYVKLQHAIRSIIYEKWPSPEQAIAFQIGSFLSRRGFGFNRLDYTGLMVEEEGAVCKMSFSCTLYGTVVSPGAGQVDLYFSVVGTTGEGITYVLRRGNGDSEVFQESGQLLAAISQHTGVAML